MHVEGEGGSRHFFSIIFHAKQPEVDMPGPRRDRCVSEFELHWTVLKKDFSVCFLVKEKTSEF